jgi:hypothetical protein
VTKALRAGSSLAIVLISIAALFGGLWKIRSALGSPDVLPAPQLPAPHLGYGLNIRLNLSMAQGMGFEWIKLYEDWLPDPNALPAGASRYHILYRLKAEGQPVSLDTYLAHVREVALAGRGKIQAYEIGNEPNLWMFWGQQAPNPERYARLLCRVYSTIKAVDANATIVSAGLAPARTPTNLWNLAMDDHVFAVRMLDTLQAEFPQQFPCFDAFGFHPQSFPYPPEISYEELQQQYPPDNGRGFYFRASEWYHTLLEQRGLGDRSIWLTEFGWLRDPAEDPWDGLPPYTTYSWCNSPHGLGEGQWMKVSEQQQADYLVRAFQYADAHMPWVGAMFVFNLDWNSQGWECDATKFFSIYKATTGRPDSDPRTKVPSLAVSALANMPKRPALPAPALTVHPTSLTLLMEVITPTIQRRTLNLANTFLPDTVHWSITISPTIHLQPIVTPLSGTDSTDVTVQINTGPIQTVGTYHAALTVNAEPTTTWGVPITIPITVIAVERLQQFYLPIVMNDVEP